MVETALGDQRSVHVAHQREQLIGGCGTLDTGRHEVVVAFKQICAGERDIHTLTAGLSTAGPSCTHAAEICRIKVLLRYVQFGGPNAETNVGADAGGLTGDIADIAAHHPDGSPLAITVGSRVAIKGLVSKPELNGKLAVVRCSVLTEFYNARMDLVPTPARKKRA
jgi:hypothetical protein